MRYRITADVDAGAMGRWAAGEAVELTDGLAAWIRDRYGPDVLVEEPDWTAPLRRVRRRRVGDVPPPVPEEPLDDDEMLDPPMPTSHGSEDDES